MLLSLWYPLRTSVEQKSFEEILGKVSIYVYKPWGRFYKEEVTYLRSKHGKLRAKSCWLIIRVVLLLVSASYEFIGTLQCHGAAGSPRRFTGCWHSITLRQSTVKSRADSEWSADHALIIIWHTFSIVQSDNSNFRCFTTHIHWRSCRWCMTLYAKEIEDFIVTWIYGIYSWWEAIDVSQTSLSASRSKDL